MSTDPNYVSLEAKQTWTVSSYPLEPSAFGSAEKVTSEIFCAFWLFTCPGKTAAYRIDGAYRGWRHTRRVAVVDGGGDNARGFAPRRTWVRGPWVLKGQSADLCSRSNTHSNREL